MKNFDFFRIFFHKGEKYFPLKNENFENFHFSKKNIFRLYGKKVRKKKLWKSQ